jgi:hypothetical protein
MRTRLHKRGKLTGAATLATTDIWRAEPPLGWAAGTRVLNAAGLLDISRAAVGRPACICSCARLFIVEYSLVLGALVVMETPA